MVERKWVCCVCFMQEGDLVSLVKGKEAAEKEMVILVEGVREGRGRHGGDTFRKEEGCFHK